MNRWEDITEANRRFDREVDAAEARRAVLMALPGYPFLPCPLCKGTEGCDDTVRERALAAHPGLSPSTIRH